MKRILYILLLTACIACLNACYKDHGNYDYVTLPGFSVDSAGLQREYLVKQYDTLKLPSRLVFEGDKSKLKFSWSAYLYTPGLGGNPADTLARTENLAAPIGLLPEKYWLEFSATNTENGRRTTFRYIINVQGVGSGMMVLYEKDNTIDCDLVKTKLLEGLLPQDEVVRQLYSIANPNHPLTGKAVSIGMFKTSTVQYISIFSDNDGVMLSPADMTISKPFNGMFSAAPDVKKPEGYSAPIALITTDVENSSGFELLVNGGQAYSNMVLFAFGKESAYSLLFASDGNYEAAPFPRYGLARIVIYDQLKMRFLGSSPLATTLTPITSTGTAFNFQNIGKKMVYMDYGYGGTYMNYAFFKNPVDDGKRYLYVVDLGASAAKYAWDVSAYENIANATIFASGTRGQLLYYAAGNNIYQVKFDYSAGKELGAVKAWPNIPAGEEITCMKLCMHPGRNVSENAKDKYLFVGTWNQSTGKGKLYVLQVNVTSGEIQQQPAAVYDGFGKIKDVAFKF